MGRKKPSVRDEANLPAVAQGGGKSKKKAVVIDDDEYSIGTELTEEPQEEEAVNNNKKKKGKKGNQKNLQAEDDDSKGEEGEENDAEAIVFTGKKKSKGKKNGGNNALSKSAFELLEGADKDDDDDDSGDKLSKGKYVSLASKGKTKEGLKKGWNKSGSLFAAAAFDAVDGGSESEVIDDDHSVEESDDDDDDVVEKSKKGGKKKSGTTGFSASAFDLLDDEDEDVREDKDEEDEPVIFTDKKKKSKKSGKNSSTFDLLVNENDDVKEDKDEDDEPITFTDKKKKSNKGGRMRSSAFDLLENEDEDDDEKKDKDEEDEPIIFTDKKKKTKSSKKTVSSFSEVLLDEENVVEDAPVLSDVSGAVDTKQQSGDSSIVESDDFKVNKGEVVAQTSKNKKKKKEKEKPRSERTAQEEDDLEKILAELGQGPAPQEEKVQVQPPEPVAPPDAADEKVGEEEKEESAASKKKKKKKEKEKEKKAAAAAAAEDKQQGKSEAVETKKNDGKSKGPEKKMSKQVREMQEALARRKEAEERKKREEEERLRKEEEERKRLEELERQAEEAKRRKKEKEKEKLLKKKQEGKLLTGKQKEEARRLEAMRNQFLAKGIPLPTGDKEAASKRPKYQTKKKSAHHQANGAVPLKELSIESKEKEQEKQETLLEVDVGETEKVEEGESLTVEEKPEIADAPKENEVEEEDDDDDEEWDAKSWDDVNLNVKGAFDDEEADSEPEPLVKKEIKSAIPSPRDAAEKPAVAVKKAIPEQPLKSQDAVTRKKEPAAKSKEPEVDATPKQAEENLRSPICCIMGHVDTGKTKLLDCIRGTNVQEGEAGGITQQIGATYFPAENIRERTRELKANATLKVPGLLVIDTPGHESFTNLRSRGSGLCDIAILVVDIMHGLEPQTIESLNLLKMRNTEFIVALNKVDRLYGWKTCRNAPIVKAIKQQNTDVQNEFNMRLVQIVTQLKEQGMNTELYYKNKDRGETFNIVPTSAISGEGIPDLLLLLVQWTQKTMVEKLTFRNELQCTVLEVKVIEGHGTTIDVVLVNGVLHEGDQIVVCGLQGPIVTTIRALLTPHPMKELRVKGTYLHHKQIKAAQGIKITAQGLEHAIAGTGLYVVGPDDDLEDVKEEAMEDMKSVMSRIDKSGEGVCVQASTLGSLEALLEFLKSDAVKIPVSGISIGPVHKKDVMRASVMLEKKKEYATILAFDVKVTPEARELAEELGVKIFIADIIYHLFDQFTAYINNLKEEKKREAADEAVFPCVLKILPNCVFNKKDPIVLGVDVVEGIAKVGTPICIPQRDFIDIGRIASIENNHKPVDTAKKGQKAAIKIAGSNSEEQQKMFGRHFDIEDELVSHISRKSIDVLKANYRDDLSMDEWRLLVKLKNLFKIQ
ncbi:eukaryotic translation initiation factor 5B [Citrus sinensis]|uniref:Eukaryotic translation initiation factor 5B n=1 Tax=Citrus clementina TaxID=85681 RepID=V4T3F8_CITCL|nr:eukaryotic translation initiation factor 5B [Citrus x clementina]XP_006473040.2 eukaryotic translation initiation factor 5B [Citrus sinensis]XP_006473041.2 eukaryotic translation initiation factor 5B [Citrus sinensis]XP_024040582.1 eukaryotic translation initiation factor 5B [Citrus x clementina]ESR47682.1 hypothetical protein CICLE_v10000034mg [Citrus x clementina]KAH9691683.1 eukaryotic translation initiation factor 5B [Citrus sinensis]